MSFLQNVPAQAQQLSSSHDDVVRRIQRLNEGLRHFWSTSHGWAPANAAELMTRSRLDWQVDLSIALRNWRDPFPADAPNGTLILAWAHLGALVEGTLKLLLSVYYEDYIRDPDAPKTRKGAIIAPDELSLEPIRAFMARRGLLSQTALAFVDLAQKRRNAIHAFRHRPLGTEAEWRTSLAAYLDLVREVNGRLPYPDDGFEPRE